MTREWRQKGNQGRKHIIKELGTSVKGEKNMMDIYLDETIMTSLGKLKMIV